MSIDYDFPGADAQSPNPGQLVSLFCLDCRALPGMTASDIYYFTPAPWDSAPVVWGGKTYTPVEVQASGFDVSGEGALPRPKIAVSNLALAMAGLVIAHDGLIGAIVTRYRTFSKYLDGQPEANSQIMFPPDVYVVERLSRRDAELIEWELAAALDRQGRKLPSLQMLRDACQHRYRRWDATLSDFDYAAATCPYATESAPAKAMSGATKANPCVVTVTAHGYKDDAVVTFDGTVGGMTQLRNTTWQITRLTADTFSLNGCNSTGWGTYTSGGNVTRRVSFDAFGNACENAQDQCGKRLSDCRKRFNGNSALPTTAFPSMAKTRV